jgi:uncharacterized protein
MRIVTIGGLGLIGSSFTELAAMKGHELVQLTRRNDQPVHLTEKIEVRHWDGKDTEKLSELMEDADAVINLAGESIGKGRWTQERKAVILKSRLEPARALVEAFKLSKNPPMTLIQASAVGIYGVGEDKKTENSPTGHDYLAKLAVEWEKSTEPIEEMGVRRIVIRTGIVLDRHQGVLPQLMLPFKLMAGGPVGSGKQIYSWIHIKDEVSAILYLLENSTCKGIYNLTSPNPLSNSDIGKKLAKVMKRPYWMPVPAIMLRSILGEMSTLILDGQKVLPQRLEEAGYQFLFPTFYETLKDLLKPA